MTDIDMARIATARRGLRTLPAELQAAVLDGGVEFDGPKFRSLERAGEALPDPAAVAPTPIDAAIVIEKLYAHPDNARYASRNSHVDAADELAKLYPSMAVASSASSAQQDDAADDQGETDDVMDADEQDDSDDGDQQGEPDDLDDEPDADDATVLYPTMNEQGVDADEVALYTPDDEGIAAVLTSMGFPPVPPADSTRLFYPSMS